MRDSAGLDVLEQAECLQLLAGAPIGRVVFTDQALPAVQPVSFAVHDETIVFATCDGRRIAEASDGAVVAFEVDEFDPGRRTGWSVTVVGRARAVTDPEETGELARLPIDRWASEDAPVFVRIAIELVNGRRIRAS